VKTSNPNNLTGKNRGNITAGDLPINTEEHEKRFLVMIHSVASDAIQNSDLTHQCIKTRTKFADILHRMATDNNQSLIRRKKDC
jgi:hypothetical protein